jgi:hypothetical protein
LSPDPFEEKGETRTNVSSCPNSVASTPCEPSALQSSDALLTDAERLQSFLYQMAEGDNAKEEFQQVLSFRSLISKMLIGPPLETGTSYIAFKIWIDNFFNI